MPDDCCLGCERHKLGCRATCAEWAAHEAAKEARYKRAAEASACRDGLFNSLERAIRNPNKRGKVKQI